MERNIAAAPLPDVTYAWIEAQLEAAGMACNAVIVVGHHPIYTGGEHGDSAELIERLLPLLETYGVDAYFCGHDHLLWAGEARGVELVLSGAGSSIRIRRNGVVSPFEKFMHEGNGFTAQSVNATHFAHHYVDDEGRVLFWRVKQLRPKLRVGRPA
jgi:3',5'-cyclic AMP phosphodiesterase CpdA